MRPLMKLLSIVALMLVIVLQACGLPAAEPRAVVATPASEPAAVLPAPAGGGPQVLRAAVGGAGSPTPAGGGPQVLIPASGAQAVLPPTAVPQSPGAAARPARWPAEMFLARVSDGLVAYNMADGQTLFHLPPGRLSADGKHYVSAELLDKDKPVTQIGLYDPTANRGQMALFADAGSWDLGAVSSNGHWAALTRIPDNNEKAAWIKAKRWQTELQILDVDKLTVAHSIKLDGNFEVDALSTDGFSLFLIEHVPAINPEHYRVRLYSLMNNKLQEGALVDKSVPPETVMTGYAWGAVATANGHWLLTLYLNKQQNVAFVHAVDLQNQFAICIDLPSGSGNFNMLKQYTLTLSPDGNKLYAANPALGVVAHIILYGSIGVVRTERFSPQGFATPPPEDAPAPVARSIISKDGSKLYFTSGWDVWAYDTLAGKVNVPILSNARITELGLSGDGARLYLAKAQLPLTVIDTATGGELRFPAGTVSLRDQ